MSETRPKDNLVGVTIDDRWSIVSKLGSGSSATVYLVRDQMIERDVALKILNERAAASNKVYRRFSREIRNIGCLNHENIIKVHSVGIYNRRPYMIMDYVNGRTLNAVAAEKPLTVDEIVQVGLQITSALTEAHSKGIIHRDIKPGNVYITESQRPDLPFIVKLLDFGMSRIQEDLLRQSQSTSLCGTPDYMSPEQSQGKNYDHRSDIYSLGCLLYEMITGQSPFTGDTSFEVIHKHITLPVPVITGCDYPGLTDIVMHCLEKQPANRFQTAAEMHKDLELCPHQRFRYSRPTNSVPAFAVKAALPLLAVTIVVVGSLVYLAQSKKSQEEIAASDRATLHEVAKKSTVAKALQELGTCQALIQTAAVEKQNGQLEQAEAHTRTAWKGITQEVMQNSGGLADKISALYQLIEICLLRQQWSEVNDLSNLYLTEENVDWTPAVNRATVLIWQSNALVNMKRYPEAITKALKSESLFKTEKKTMDLAARAASTAAHASILRNNYRDALRYATLAVSDLKKSDPTASPHQEMSIPHTIMDLASITYSKQDFPTAYQLYQLALDGLLSVKPRSPTDSTERLTLEVIIRFGLADTAVLMKRYDESFVRLNDILVLVNKHPDHPDFLNNRLRVYNEHGTFNIRRNDLVAAEKDFLEAAKLDVNQRIMDYERRSPPDWGTARKVSNLPPSEFMPYNEQSVEYAKKMKTNPAEAASYLLRMGQVYNRVGNNEKALLSFADALTIYQRINDVPNQKTCTIYLNATKELVAAHSKNKPDHTSAPQSK